MDALDAASALIDAAASVGISARLDDSPGSVVLDVSGHSVTVGVHPTALVSPRDVAELHRSAIVPAVIVADRVVGDARTALRRAGLGWLDLRGHLYLVAPGVLVDTEVAPQRERPQRTSAFSGTAGIDVACALLLDPDEPVSVRGVARAVDRSPSTVSEVTAALDDAGLLGRDRRPRLPDLFWAVADEWRPRVVPLETLPVEDAAMDALQVDPRARERVGWAVGDSLAAARYDAPIGMSAGYPPDFHVPTEAVLRRATATLGVAPPGAAPAATARIAPSRLVCTRRIRDDGFPWALAQPVFVALDLAADPGRGQEIVHEWDPPGWARRVW